MKRPDTDPRYTAMKERITQTGICDCGHAPEHREPGACTTGYGYTGEFQSRCLDCCAVEELRYMRENGRATLYLTGNLRDGYSVVGWSGKPKFRATGVRHSKHACFGGYTDRTDAWFTIPGDPFLWHAVSRGDMELARARRTKERA